LCGEDAAKIYRQVTRTVATQIDERGTGYGARSRDRNTEYELQEDMNNILGTCIIMLQEGHRIISLPFLSA
jgi:hypothetical protein